jgi:hypothetical protein
MLFQSDVDDRRKVNMMHTFFHRDRGAARRGQGWQHGIAAVGQKELTADPAANHHPPVTRDNV